MDIDLNGDEDDFEEEIPHESIYPNVTTPARNVMFANPSMPSMPIPSAEHADSTPEVKLPTVSSDGAKTSSRVQTQRMSMTRRASVKLREIEELKEADVPNSPIKQSASVFVKPASRLSEDIERMKTQDIQIDANSFADKALQLNSTGDKQSLKKRMSVRGLFGNETNTDSTSSAAAAAAAAAANGAASANANANANDEEEPIERKVEGREIKQDHELYALTYGMMLGIRVMTGRADKELDMMREEARTPRNTHGNGSGSHSPSHSSTSDNNFGGSSKAVGQMDSSEDDEFLLELRDEDFSFGLELEFPPEGSTNSSTRLSFKRATSPTSSSPGSGGGASSPERERERMPHIDEHEEGSETDHQANNFQKSKSLFSSFGSSHSLRSSSGSVGGSSFYGSAGNPHSRDLNEIRSRAGTQSTRSSFTSLNSARTLGGDRVHPPAYMHVGTPTPPHKLKSSFSFKDYMPLPFRVVRALSGIDEGDFMVSVAGDFNYIEFIANSKSGQFFFYSHDGKYMIKTATKEESKLLRTIMPAYIQHLHDFPNSLLVRFYGMYRVKMDFLSVKTIYFVVMSSVFNTEKPIHVKYDLKGSTVGRVVSAADCAAGAVQKDLNLQQSGRKLRFGLPNIEMLRTTLKYDAAFLASLNIMDYSLLVGIHEQSSRKAGRRHSGVRTSVRFSRLAEKKNNMRFAVGPGQKAGCQSLFQSYHGGIKSAPEANEIYFIGIIDILQLYNAGKRAETIFKSIRESSAKLSSVPARFYANRFVDFIMSVTDYEDICSLVDTEAEVKEREWEEALKTFVRKGGNPALFPRELQL